MSRFWSSLTHDLKPYVPGEKPRMAELVKLNTNESPFGPSPRVFEAMRGEAADTLRLYPDPQASALRAALATYHQVRSEQVFVGNGSDEVLAHAFAALLKHDAPLLFPDITYSFYPVYCRLFGIAYEAVPLDQAMQIRVADYRRPAGALILPNPNAPTGVALSRAEIVALLEQHPGAPVVIDEAYVDFGAETAIPLVASHPNLLVVQTMSKSRALAGLRVGYAIGDADLIEALTRVKDSFNSYPLRRPAQAGAIASLADEAHFQQARARVIEGRARLNLGLGRLGFDVLPSSAHFVLAHAARKVEICRRFGLHGLPPLNEDVETATGNLETWQTIYQKDIAMMQRCDIIIANLTPFGGASADAGTLIEVGWFLGKAKPIFGYSNTSENFESRMRRQLGDRRAEFGIEGFHLPDNLMIVGAVHSGGYPI